MDMESFVAFEPSFHLRMFVCCIIVDNKMKLQLSRRLRIDLFKEFYPFLVSVAGHARCDDFALGHFHGGEESCCAVSFVVMRHGPASTGNKRQTRLGSVERLYLAFLISTDDECLFRRVEIEADDIN